MNSPRFNLALRNAVCFAIIIVVLVGAAIVIPMVQAEAKGLMDAVTLTVIP